MILYSYCFRCFPNKVQRTRERKDARIINTLLNSVTAEGVKVIVLYLSETPLDNPRNGRCENNNVYYLVGLFHNRIVSDVFPNKEQKTRGENKRPDNEYIAKHSVAADERVKVIMFISGPLKHIL